VAGRLRTIARDFCPPLVWRNLSMLRDRIRPHQQPGAEGRQDLAIYWDAEMAQVLETWGDGNAWNEIQFLMSQATGKALDIACGTGKVISLLAEAPGLEVHGCDISDLLIGKAIGRGIPAAHLKVCDATQLPYPNGAYDYSYSIGSLEHFTEEGIGKFISEAARITRVGSFHMMPTSRSGRDEGWMKTYQSFHNCSPAWWVSRFERAFGHVRVLDSTWNDRISVGKWFLCSH
jgi:ubiquinone/menaquinone biosynthesis C-methylase UbiE